MTNALTITATTTDPSRHARAVFVWSSDLSDCEMTAYGLSDEEIDSLVASRVHEGADADGFNVEIG